MSANPAEIQLAYNRYLLCGRDSDKVDISHLKVSEFASGISSSPQIMKGSSQSNDSAVLSGGGRLVTTKVSRLRRFSDAPSFGVIGSTGASKPDRRMGTESLEGALENLFEDVTTAWSNKRDIVPVELSARSIFFFVRCRRLLLSLIGCIPRLEGLLGDCVDELDKASRFFSEIADETKHLRAQLSRTRQDFEDKLQDVRFSYRQEVVKATNELESFQKARDDAVKSAAALRERLEVSDENRKQLQEKLRVLQLLYDRDRVESLTSRGQINQLHDKSNVIIAENRYLREVAEHNSKLLADIQNLESKLLQARKENIQLLRRIEENRSRCSNV